MSELTNLLSNALSEREREVAAILLWLDGFLD